MSGMLAPRMSAARPLRLRSFSPAWPSAQPVSEWVKLSIRRPPPKTAGTVRTDPHSSHATGTPRDGAPPPAEESFGARFLLDLPGLALGDERLEVGLLAGSHRRILFEHGALERRR